MRPYLCMSAALVALVAAQPACADAVLLDPGSLSAGDAVVFSTAVDNGIGGFAATTAGGTTVQLSGTSGASAPLTTDATGASFSSGVEFLTGDYTGNTSAFDNAVFTILLPLDFQAGTTNITVFTDGFGNSSVFPVSATAGANTYAVGAINGETLSAILFETGAGTTGELTSLAFNAQAGTEIGGGELPEPATWAMMLLGFGGIGTSLRRRRGMLKTPQLA